MKKESKVYFTLTDKNGPGTESLNAEMISQEKYKILNIPFFVFNIAWGDIVKTRIIDGLLYAYDVVQHSGHSTVRIFFLQEGMSMKEMQDYLKPINEMNCFYEHSQKRFFTLDIPQEVKYQKVLEYLSKLESEKVIEYEEAFIYSKFLEDSKKKKVT